MSQPNEKHQGVSQAGKPWAPDPGLGFDLCLTCGQPGHEWKECENEFNHCHTFSHTHKICKCFTSLYGEYDNASLEDEQACIQEAEGEVQALKDHVNALHDKIRSMQVMADLVRNRVEAAKKARESETNEAESKEDTSKR